MTRLKMSRHGNNRIQPAPSDIKVGVWPALDEPGKFVTLERVEDTVA